MTRIFFTRFLPGLAGYLLSLSTPALDTALPFYGEDLDARITVEMLVEDMKRDIRQQDAFTGETFDGEQKEKRLIARVTGYPTERIQVYGLLGLANSEDADNFAPMLGGGIRARVGSMGGFRLGALAGGYWVEGIEYTSPGVLTPFEEFAASYREESYYEWGLGLVIDRAWLVTSRTQLVPFAGMTWSMMQADGKETFAYPTTGRIVHDDQVDFEDDSPFALVGGLALLVNRNFGLRIEGRFVDQTSLSAGLFFSF